MLISLMKHQQVALDRSKNQKNMFLAWDMGTGKTLTTASIIAPYQNLNVLILCPKPVVSGWVKEFKQHLGIEIIELTGKMVDKVDQLNHSEGIVVTNFEFLSRSKQGYEAMKRFSPKVLVIDEAHRCKSPSSQLGKRVTTLAKTTERNILLSGTPILNGIDDIYNQYKILEANEDNPTFGHTIGDFRMRYMFDANEPKRAKMFKSMGRYFPDWQPRMGAPLEVASLMQKKTMFIRQSECLDLPPVLRKKYYCQLEGDQKRAYKGMQKEFITFIESQKDEPRVALATQATTKAIRLQQICNGFVKDECGEEIGFRTNPKNEILKQLLEEHCKKGKVVVWANFKRNYNDIRLVCRDLSIGFAEYHGEIKYKEVEKRKFLENDDCRVMIAHPASAGTGLDGLQIAPVCIYYSRGFNLEHDQQSEKRTMRKGSEIHKKLLRIDIVMESSIDEKVLEALEKKQKIQDVILDWKL